MWCAVLKPLERLAEKCPLSESEPLPARIPLSGANFPIRRGERRSIQALCLEQIHFAPGRTVRGIADSIGRVREDAVSKALGHLRDKGVAQVAEGDTWWPVETPSSEIHSEPRTAPEASDPIYPTGGYEPAITRAVDAAGRHVLKHSKRTLSVAETIARFKKDGDLSEFQLKTLGAWDATVELVKAKRLEFVEDDRFENGVYRLTTKPEVTE